MVPVGQPEQTGLRYHVVPSHPGGITPAVETLVVLQHGMQPEGIGHPGGPQHLVSPLRVGLDGIPLGIVQRLRLVNQLRLELGHRHVAAQCSGNQAEPPLGLPTETPGHQLAQQRGVDTVPIGIRGFMMQMGRTQRGIRFVLAEHLDDFSQLADPLLRADVGRTPLDHAEDPLQPQGQLIQGNEGVSTDRGLVINSAPFGIGDDGGQFPPDVPPLLQQPLPLPLIGDDVSLAEQQLATVVIDIPAQGATDDHLSLSDPDAVIWRSGITPEGNHDDPALYQQPPQ